MHKPNYTRFCGFVRALFSIWRPTPINLWLGDYFATCVQRDLRQLLNLPDPALFEKCRRPCSTLVVPPLEAHLP